MVRALKLGSAITAFCALALAVFFTGGAAAAASSSPYIVTLKSTVADPAAHAKNMGVTPTAVYKLAIKGYAFSGTLSKASSISKDKNVLRVDADKELTLDPIEASKPGFQGDPLGPQIVANSVRRVRAPESRTAQIDGRDQRVNVDVAVIDGGIQPDHPDLNVVGGTDCAPGDGWADRDGHGTMVGGLVGAIDNAIGRVGVAPGARLWGVRVGKPNGTISTSSLLCGLDWVAANSATIEVANMSLSGNTNKTGACSGNDATNIQLAVCAVIARGVTVTASAGNDSTDAGGLEPALIPEVITVSAFADNDGLPGALGGPLTNCPVAAEDDHFASFSNFGSVVDISAPGVCLGSTFINSTTAVSSGTSFSAPLVAGGAALYIATHPGATPSTVQAAIKAAAEPGPILDDPDQFPEGVLDVSGF
jgi:subtilisin